MPGEDAPGPPIRTTNLDKVMGKDAGVTAGEGVSFRGRRAAGFDRPGFELRRKVGPVQVGDWQARRMGTPIRRIEVLREILPRTHRRTPFPGPELTLTRPAHATGKPARAEVMEEREKH